MNVYTYRHPTLQQKFMDAGRVLVTTSRTVQVIKGSQDNHVATVYKMESGKFLVLTPRGEDITRLISLPLAYL